LIVYTELLPLILYGRMRGHC